MPSKAKPEPKKPRGRPRKPEPSPDVIEICSMCGQHHPKCLAHKRRKSKDDPYVPCMQAPTKGNKARKCKFHGGQSLSGIAHPNYTDGRTSKYLYIPSKKMQERAQALATDQISNLAESVSITAMLETRFLERLGTTESTEAWNKLKAAVQAHKAANGITDEKEKAAARARAFGMISFIVDEGLSESFLVSDIMRAQEHQRKLSETVSKIKLQNSQALTLDTWEWLLSLVLKIIRQNVTDRDTLTNLQRAFQSEFDSGSQQLEVSS